MKQKKDLMKLPQTVVHIGIVVKDIEEIQKNYSSIFGVGPWRTAELSGIADVRDGNPTYEPYTVKIAIG